MITQKFLFDLSQFEKCKTPSQKDFEVKNLDLLLAFREMIPRCFERLNKEVFSVIEPISQDKNLPSVVMSGYLRGEFIKQFPQCCYKATKQRFVLIGEANEQIFIKKLDAQMRPSNIPTIDSLLIYNQRSKSYSETNPNVFLGYVAEDDWSGYTGIYAVCIDGKKTIWATDLSMLDDNRLTNTIKMPIQPIVPTAPRIKEGVVKIKRKQAE